MKDVVDSKHCILTALKAADITNEEFNFSCYFRHLDLILVTHVILLLLITREDTDFSDVCAKKTI